MSTYNLRRFSQSDVLKSIRPDKLLAFLNPYADYLTERGFFFVATDDGELDYEMLAGILMNPNDKIPIDMVEALYFIQEMSDATQFDDLLKQAEQSKIEVLDEYTTTDLALALWLHDPELLKRPHAEVLALKPKSFVSYQAKENKEAQHPQSDSRTTGRD